MPSSCGPETERLLRLASTGDAHARGELLERFRDRLRRAIAGRLDRRMAARVDASDIVQEALNNAYARLPEFFSGPPLPFYPWLRRIAGDRLIDMHRVHITASKRSVLKEQADVPAINEAAGVLASRMVDSTQSPSRRAIQQEQSARLKVALLKLPDVDRDVLLMRYVELLTVDEIAVATGMTPTAVTSRHYRALRKLRRLLDDPAER